MGGGGAVTLFGLRRHTKVRLPLFMRNKTITTVCSNSIINSSTSRFFNSTHTQSYNLPENQTHAMKVFLWSPLEVPSTTAWPSSTTPATPTPSSTGRGGGWCWLPASSSGRGRKWPTTMGCISQPQTETWEEAGFRFVNYISFIMYLMERICKLCMSTWITHKAVFST